MTNINLINAMGRIAPELIADAAPDAAQKEPTHKAWEKCVSVVVAACLCLMIAGAAYYFAGNSGNEPSVIYPGYTENHRSITKAIYSKMGLRSLRTRTSAKIRSLC